MLRKKYSLLFLLCLSMVEINFAQVRQVANHPSDTRGTHEAYLFARLQALQYQKDYSAAIELLRSALARAKNDYQLHYALAIAFIRSEDFERAQRQLMNTIALMPNFAPPHNLLGRLVYKQNRTASFMALCFYNLLAPQSLEARHNFSYLKELSSRPTCSAQLHASSRGVHKKRANDFSSIDVMLTAENSMNKGFSTEDPDYFLMRFNWFCKSLQKNAMNQSGFFWKFYAPYFIDIYNLGYARAAVWVLFDKAPKTLTLAREIKAFKAWNEQYLLKRFYRF